MTITDAEGAALQTKSKRGGNPDWKPGVSGNPSGRPKTVGQIRDLARRNTRPAFATILRLMRDKSAPHSTRLAAAQEVLDRAYGRAPQKYEVEVSVFDSLSPDHRALLDMACELLLARAGDSPKMLEGSVLEVPATVRADNS